MQADGKKWIFIQLSVKFPDSKSCHAEVRAEAVALTVLLRPGWTWLNLPSHKSEWR